MHSLRHEPSFATAFYRVGPVYQRLYSHGLDVSLSLQIFDDHAIRSARNLQGIVKGRKRGRVSFLWHLAQRYWDEALRHGAPRPATVAVRYRTVSRKIGRHNLLLDRPLFVNRLRRVVTSALAEGHLELHTSNRPCARRRTTWGEFSEPVPFDPAAV